MITIVQKILTEVLLSSVVILYILQTNKLLTISKQNNFLKKLGKTKTVPYCSLIKTHFFISN